MISRNPEQFLKRKQILPTYRSGSRLDTGHLLVHQFPTGPTEEDNLRGEGCPAPDRPLLKDFTPPSSGV